MTRATEKWREAVRYAADDASKPRSSERNLLRPRRLFLIVSFGVMLAFVGFTSYASRGSVPAVEPFVEAPERSVASANLQPSRKRSFTSKNAGASTRSSVPQTTPAEPFSQVSNVPALEPAIDATTTGAITAPTTNSARRTFSKPGSHGVAKQTTFRQARRYAEHRSAEPRARKVQYETRRSTGAAKRVSERAAPPLLVSARPDRTKPQPLAVKVRAERVVATAPAKVVSVCLYFVLCF
jgi:hypothetical protein